MDDLSEKIGEILNDEESMRQIRELADMLTGSVSAEENPRDSQNPEKAESFDPDSGEKNSQSAGGFPDLSMLMNMLGGGNGGESSGNSNSGFDFDFGTAMKLMSAVQGAGANDKNLGLLIALRPLLSADKQAKTDKAIKFMRLYAIYNAVRDSGFKF